MSVHGPSTKFGQDVKRRRPHDNAALLLDTEAVEPRDGAVQPTQGKRKYIFIRKVVLDVLKVYVNEM